MRKQILDVLSKYAYSNLINATVRERIATEIDNAINGPKAVPVAQEEPEVIPFTKEYAEQEEAKAAKKTIAKEKAVRKKESNVKKTKAKSRKKIGERVPKV